MGVLVGVLVGVLASRAGWSSNDSRSWILVVLEATRTTLDHEIEHVLRSTSTSTTSEHDNASVCRIALKATVFHLGGFFGGLAKVWLVGSRHPPS